MDKKNTTIGILLLLAAMGALFLGQPKPPPPGAEPPPVAPGGVAEGENASPPPPSLELEPAARPGGPAGLFETVEGARAGEELATLGNDFIEVRFSNYGGAIAEVVLKRYPATKRGDAPYILNAHRAAPALALLDFPGADRHTVYELVETGPRSIVWRAVVEGRVEVTRTYTINDGEGEPYLIRHETRLRNLGDQSVNTAKLSFSLGTAEPVDAKDPGQHLNVGVYDGDDDEFIGRSDFEPGFFARNFGGDTRAKSEIAVVRPVVWASVKNQFFTAVFEPDQPGVGVTARRVELALVEGESLPRIAVTGALHLDPVRVAPGEESVLGFDYYAGPKEYDRLVRLGAGQDRVMEFGFFGFFSKLLLYLLKFLQGYVGNWGVAIIGTTIIVRSLMWPLTASASKSAKRMGRIQPLLKELQEKYKDNKQKQQEAMLALFREHKINPVGGCLPIFIQLPIFFGLFTMLSSASELRFAEFLWVPDLSAPDTVARLFGIPVNIMPLLMGISMHVQMRMTPTPTIDNSAAKIMKFMPIMVTVMCYTFSSGLAVYWTASNLFSIFQQWVTNRSKDPVAAAAAPEAATRPARVKELAPTRGAKRKRR